MGQGAGQTYLDLVGDMSLSQRAVEHADAHERLSHQPPRNNSFPTVSLQVIIKLPARKRPTDLISIINPD